MPRHRAPTTHRTLSTVALTGAALGASVISPLAADAATPHAAHRHHHAARHHQHTEHHRHLARPRATLRPMTSGEQQYRNGCQRGYITQDCALFSAQHLLERGIDPYL
jgi:hypothetical protein